VRQLVTDTAAKPLIASCAGRTCGTCSQPLHPGLLWRHRSRCLAKGATRGAPLPSSSCRARRSHSRPREALEMAAT
jgi:hypothetical protein